MSRTLTRTIPKTQTLDPCGDTTCLVPPAEFVRLRYFFGQRLGVVDFFDEQSYLVGKQRFHNLLAHGVGVLCGLRATRYVFPQGSPPTADTTLLRVSRGAALDACGREIVVGWDQCIDVAAWFAQHPEAAQSADELNLRLWIALCYRECPSDPAPAPRDPCGCETNGCEFARIREGFELSLVTDEEAEEMAPRDVGNAGECPKPLPDSCLLLANFVATLDQQGKKVVNISGPDNDIPERLRLLPTAELQELLLQVSTDAGSAGLSGRGPHLRTLTFENGGVDSGTLSIGIQTTGTDQLSRDPLAAPAQIAAKVSRFKDDGTWEVAPVFTASYVAGTSSGINLDWAAGAGLIDGGRYRVLLESDREQPPVDQKMRPLTPYSWARHFRLVKDAGGNLVLAESLYA